MYHAPDPIGVPRRRRKPRTVFHYKVDEDLRPEDRGTYLALLHAPRTRIDDAHAWLTARGYVLSRSAVARHRRRLLAAEQSQADDRERASAFARMATSPGARAPAAHAAPSAAARNSLNGSSLQI